jgi:cyclic pyranopterin phosphate synthase
MTSNGIVLTRKLDDLVNAGLNKLNISLDTLIQQKFELITRRNGFDKVWKCIEKAEPMFNRLKVCVYRYYSCFSRSIVLLFVM